VAAATAAVRDEHGRVGDAQKSRFKVDGRMCVLKKWRARELQEALVAVAAVAAATAWPLMSEERATTR